MPFYQSASAAQASKCTAAMKIYSCVDSGRSLVAARLSTHKHVPGNDIAMLADPNAEDIAHGSVELFGGPEPRTGMGDAARIRAAKDFSPEAGGQRLNGCFGHETEPRLETDRAAN